MHRCVTAATWHTTHSATPLSSNQCHLGHGNAFGRCQHRISSLHGLSNRCQPEFTSDAEMDRGSHDLATEPPNAPSIPAERTSKPPPKTSLYASTAIKQPTKRPVDPCNLRPEDIGKSGHELTLTTKDSYMPATCNICKNSRSKSKVGRLIQRCLTCLRWSHHKV